jgi:putative ABC transport system permease protein
VLKNYLTVIYRNFFENKFLNAINILGLAIGMAACLLILLYVAQEKSYDDFHVNAKDIYRINIDVYSEGKLAGRTAQVPCPLGPTMKDIFPDVKKFTRLASWGNSIVRYKDNSQRAAEAFLAETSLLTMFSFPLVKGDPTTALDNKNNALLSESFAKKLFGNEDPMDKEIIYQGHDRDIHYVIKGIFKDLPKNSHLQFDLLLSIKGVVESPGMRDNWKTHGIFNLYVLLNPHTNIKNMTAKLNELAKQKVEKGMKAIVSLQPLRDIHLYSGHLQWDYARGNYKIVYFFSILALFILIIAWTNYIIITTARSINRAPEVGMRKVIGATRKQLIGQFLFESLLVNIFCAILALILARILLPGFNRFFGLNLSMSILANANVGLPLLALLFGGSILFGGYPAFVLSSYKPVSILTGKLRSSAGGKLLRKILLVFQIVVAVCLIATTVSVYKQIDYMNKQDLGINIHQVLLVLNPTFLIVEPGIIQSGERFVRELQEYPEITSVTSSNVPGEPYFTSEDLRRENSDVKYLIKFGIIDYNFFDTYGAKLVAGRNFSKEFPTDKDALLFNKKAIQLFGFESPEKALHQVLNSEEKKYKIIGVLDNYHQTSLRDAIDPVCFKMHPYSPHTYLSVKLNTKNLTRAIDLIRAKYKEHFPGFPFEYLFLDEYFSRQYNVERNVGKMAGMFSLLAIFIACIGMWALAVYAVVTRTKEIGIRKAVGATVSRILILLSKDFIILIAVAHIIALPLAYFGVKKFLENYAYRIEIGWWLFVIPIGIVLLSALLTVSYHVFKIATSNPVDSLRYE